jgi:hypothetical protein
MKYLFSILFFLLCESQFAQNVGIGTTTPQSKLQINHNSVGSAGLTLVDSAISGMGKQFFQNRNFPNRNIGFIGFFGGNSAPSTYLDVATDSLAIATFRGNGNVGINNVSPNERLDISGNMNISSGTIKANGVAGQEGQYLGTNSIGELQWMDRGAYKNFVLLYAIPGVSPQLYNDWPVPPGVTKVMVELWGAGGGGSALGGGGGGAYICATINVTGVSNLSYKVGLGGAGSLTSGGSGSGTILLPNPSIAYYALGGSGASSSSTFPSTAVGSGGSWEVATSSPPPGPSPMAFNVFGYNGQPGRGKTISISQRSATEFIEFLTGGDGGNAGNSYNTGCFGDNASVSSTGELKSHSYHYFGTLPGGGGGSGYKSVHISSPQQATGKNGANGLIIIHY